MSGDLWVSPAPARTLRGAGRGSFSVRPDGSVVGPSGRGNFSFEETVESLGWDVQMGGLRLPDVSYDIESDAGLGKRRSLLKKIKKIASPKAQVKMLKKGIKVQKLMFKLSTQTLIHPQKFKQNWRTLEQIHRIVTPKPLRKLGTKKNFIKYAPYLAAVAMVLNFIVPGLGVVVAAAIKIGADVLKMRQAKKDLKKLQAAEKQADVKAVAAYDQSAGYFQEKYGVSREQFQGMNLEEKMNFLQQAVEDAKEEETPAGKLKAAVQSVGAVGWGLSAAGVLVLLLL